MYELKIRLRRKILYYRLKFYVKHKKNKFINVKKRGIGKTFTLLQLAHEYDIPILEPGIFMRDNVKRWLQTYRDIEEVEVLAPNNLYKLEYGSLLLVDERQLLDKDTRFYLARFTCVGVETIGE